MNNFKRVLVGIISLLAYQAVSAEPGSYQIDSSHSKVGFEVPHLVISTVEGNFRQYEGKVEINKDFSKSNVTAVIKTESIDTGVGKRDDHLRSPDFFDVKRHPDMAFKSTSLKGKPESFQLEGELSLKGIKKKVTFEGKFLGAATDAYGNRRVAFVARAKINRKDFGLTWNSMVEAGPVVGDEVAIELKIQALRPMTQKQAAN